MPDRKIPIVLLLLIVPFTLTAQEPVVPRLLSREIPNQVMDLFPFAMAVLPDSQRTKTFSYRISAGAAYDYTLLHRSPEKKTNIRRFSRDITVERFFSDNRQNPHRLSLYYNEDASRLNLRSLNNDYRFRTENISRSWTLSYSRDLFDVFGFQIRTGRMNGVNGGQWSYGTGLRFVNERVEWSFEADRKFHSRESLVQYRTDTAYVPADYGETECRIGLKMKNIKKTSFELSYLFNQYDSEYRKINRFSALLDGAAETLDIRVYRFFRKGACFVRFRSHEWDYRIYTWKNDRQYGKINVPVMKWTEFTAGMQYRINSVRSVQTACRYGYGKEHIGMIIDSWPFTSTLANLLGVKNYNSTDGNIRLHSVFIQFEERIADRHQIEPFLGFIYAGVRGRYAYRKQDAFFNVIERGEYRMNEQKKYFIPGLTYRFVWQDFIFRMEGRQMIPIGKDKTVFDSEKVKTYGGLFARMNLTFRF